ncbi:MAG TPA: hypothetical protein VKT49_03875 [Bryobacteraceae bacterium]|nr:hypothetical protein [Bryobacteraceae bacterium]
MTAVAQLSKLSELRAKTDQDLVILTGNALEVGIQCAEAAANKPGPLHEKAQNIYANSLMLLSKIENMKERRRLESKARHLQELLDFSRVAKIAACTAC